ncbi:MAG: hypothetical protein V1853_01660 [bacterium]
MPRYTYNVIGGSTAFEEWAKALKSPVVDNTGDSPSIVTTFASLTVSSRRIFLTGATMRLSKRPPEPPDLKDALTHKIKIDVLELQKCEGPSEAEPTKPLMLRFGGRLDTKAALAVIDPEKPEISAPDVCVWGVVTLGNKGCQGIIHIDPETQES